MLTNLVRDLDDHDLSVLHTRNTQNGLVGVACVNPLQKKFASRARRTFRNIVTLGLVISGRRYRDKDDSDLHNCTISSHYVQAARTESRFKRQIGSNSLLFTPFKTV